MNASSIYLVDHGVDVVAQLVRVLADQQPLKCSAINRRNATNTIDTSNAVKIQRQAPTPGPRKPPISKESQCVTRGQEGGNPALHLVPMTHASAQEAPFPEQPKRQTPGPGKAHASSQPDLEIESSSSVSPPTHPTSQITPSLLEEVNDKGKVIAYTPLPSAAVVSIIICRRPARQAT